MALGTRDEVWFFQHQVTCQRLSFFIVIEDGEIDTTKTSGSSDDYLCQLPATTPVGSWLIPHVFVAQILFRNNVQPAGSHPAVELWQWHGIVYTGVPGAGTKQWEASAVEKHTPRPGQCIAFPVHDSNRMLASMIHPKYTLSAISITMLVIIVMKG